MLMFLFRHLQLTPASSKRSPGYRLLTARNITRPQSQFRDKIDNSGRAFIPKIVTKPNALRPLAGALSIFIYILKQYLILMSESVVLAFKVICS